MSWTAPADNGASITDYDVRHRACTANPATCASNPTWGQWTTLSGNADPGTTTTATITGLTNGTAYQVQVQATNSVGDSGWSDSTNGTPAAQKPAAPLAPTLTVDNARLGVEWSAPVDNGSAITDYNVQYRKQKTDNSWPSTWSSHAHTGTTTTASITGLTNDSAYQVQVQAVNGVGDGAWSASSEATPTAQKPDAPVAPSLTKGARQLSVSWTEPATNGADITDYDVRHRVKDTNQNQSGDQPGSWTTLTGSDDPGTTTTATITGLTNGTEYQVQVQATNSAGDSSWSPSATAAPEDAPAAPAAPTLTYGDQSLGVEWSAPADNGQDISDYDVRYCVNTTGCANDSDWDPAERHREQRHEHRDHGVAHGVDEWHHLPGAGAGRQQCGRRSVVGVVHREALHGAERAHGTDADSE